MQQKGFIRLIVLVIIGLIILKFFFKFDVIDYFNSEEFRSFASQVGKIISSIWEYLVKVISYTWNQGKDLLLKAFLTLKNIGS